MAGREASFFLFKELPLTPPSGTMEDSDRKNLSCNYARRTLRFHHARRSLGVERNLLQTLDFSALPLLLPRDPLVEPQKQARWSTSVSQHSPQCFDTARRESQNEDVCFRLVELLLFRISAALHHS